MRAGTLPGPRPPVSATKRGGGEYTVPTFSTLTENLDMGGHKRYPLKKSMNHYDFADVRGSENSCRRCPRKSESREKEPVAVAREHLRVARRPPRRTSS